MDKLKGFRLGADDYIVKPIDEEELIARIKAILKRAQTWKENPLSTEQQIFILGKFQFDYLNRRLASPTSSQILTEKRSGNPENYYVRKKGIFWRESLPLLIFGAKTTILTGGVWMCIFPV